MSRLLVLWLCLLQLPALAQQTNYLDKFWELMKGEETDKVQRLLQDWEKQEPRNPDLYVAQFNFLLSQASRLEVSQRPARPGEFAITDKKRHKEVGSLGQGYDPALLAQAQAQLRKGIALAPSRLDMRYGLAKVAEENGDAPEQCRILAEALDYRAKSGQPWLWRGNGPLPAPEDEFVPGTLEEYINYYWRQETREAAESGYALTKLLLQYYPQNSLGYFNAGVYFNLTNKKPQMVEMLRKADQLQPNDPYTIANLLQASIDLKDKAAANGYLARLKKFPEMQQAVEQASRDLRKL